MSKFEEICAAYKDSKENFNSYRKESMDFAISLGGKYIQYLGVGKEHFRWVPEAEQDTKSTGFTIPGAMHLDEDTYWHLGLKIRVFSAPNIMPQQDVFIVFMFKKVADCEYAIKLRSDDKPFIIETDKDTSYTVFFNYLQKLILEIYQDDLTNFLESAQSSRRIGF
ncbi:hypothetical protein [Serratia plymuthica]|uniref:hypothetical protein n=1 Tax=Serratia plymuthica TaxID=82996 RepID=UPI000937CF2D|nr:hypothetical protein [Serratia plymuthica]OJT38445.1 hypothetical protein BSR04_18420 [Serratia plymuthica]